MQPTWIPTSVSTTSWIIRIIASSSPQVNYELSDVSDATVSPDPSSIYIALTFAIRVHADYSIGHGMPVREETSRGAAVGAVRLQSGWQAEGHRYTLHIPGDQALSRKLLS